MMMFDDETQTELESTDGTRIFPLVFGLPFSYLSLYYFLVPDPESDLFPASFEEHVFFVSVFSLVTLFFSPVAIIIFPIIGFIFKAL